MVSGSQPSTSVAVPLLAPRRQALKSNARRKGLSAFYASKSQSFNCISDLQRNPFSQSAVVLGKRSMSQAWQQPFGSIQEDMCDCDCVESPRHSVSAPGSPFARAAFAHWSDSTSLAGCCHPHAAECWAGSSNGKLHSLQHSTEQPYSDQGPLAHMCAASSGCITEGGSLPSLSSLGPFDSLSHTLSGSSDGGSVDTCDDAAEVTGDACCDLLEQPTEGLCSALKAATLAAQQPKQAVQLLHVAHYAYTC